MQSYNDFTKYFGISLYDSGFQHFLAITFSDLSEYDIIHSDYMVSEKEGIELCFSNVTAVYDKDDYALIDKGNPIFVSINLYHKPLSIIIHLPFDITFAYKRSTIIDKAGQPTKTNKGYAVFLEKDFLIDHYKIDNLIISFDYNPDNQKLNFIQLRDNNLAEEHIKL